MSEFTNCTLGEQFPPISIESLEGIIRRVTDRQPAAPVEVRVHPNYFDVFIADLVEEGAQRVSASPAFSFGLPVFKDPDVPFRVKRMVYPEGGYEDLP